MLPIMLYRRWPPMKFPWGLCSCICTVYFHELSSSTRNYKPRRISLFKGLIGRLSIPGDCASEILRLQPLCPQIHPAPPPHLCSAERIKHLRSLQYGKSKAKWGDQGVDLSHAGNGTIHRIPLNWAPKFAGYPVCMGIRAIIHASLAPSSVR